MDDQKTYDRAAPRPESPSAGHLATLGLLPRAVAVWLVLMGAEVAHGVLRTLYLAPLVGDLRARQIGVLVGSALILIIARVAAPWLRARTSRAQLLVGGVWLVLTLVFELVLGLVLGYSWERTASDYDVLRGGLLPFGLVVLALAPRLAARWHRRS